MILTFFKHKDGRHFHESELTEKNPTTYQYFRRGEGPGKVTKKSLTEVKEDLVDDLNDPLEIQFLATVYGVQPIVALLENSNKVNHFVCPGYVAAALRLPHEPDFYKDFQNRFGGIHPFSLNCAMMAVFGMFSFDIVAFDTLLKNKFGYKEETHGSLNDFLVATQGQEFTASFRKILIEHPILVTKKEEALAA